MKTANRKHNTRERVMAPQQAISSRVKLAANPRLVRM